jgi:hypothetical protein
MKGGEIRMTKVKLVDATVQVEANKNPLFPANLFETSYSCEKVKAPQYITVNVRWRDGYLEVFECSQVRQGADILWMRLSDNQNRTIPLQHVRWFSTDPESHASSVKM